MVYNKNENERKKIYTDRSHSYGPIILGDGNLYEKKKYHEFKDFFKLITDLTSRVQLVK